MSIKMLLIIRTTVIHNNLNECIIYEVLVNIFMVINDNIPDTSIAQLVYVSVLSIKFANLCNYVKIILIYAE